MTRLQRAAIIIDLIENLHTNRSWCGETHVQKAAYFLQHLLGVPLEFDFILYKHGPFSFDLSDELTAMRGDMLLTLKLQDPYGPSILIGQGGERIRDLYPKTIAKYSKKVRFVANELGAKNVAELERLATALYVTLGNGQDGTVESRVENLVKLKPHILHDQAQEAVSAVDRIRKKADTVDI